MTDIVRTTKLIKQAIDKLDLDLTGLTVYTEAATGVYSCTAPTAAAAGADEVIAIASTSPYGSAAQAEAQTEELASKLGCRDRITFVRERSESDFRRADIVTNSGFVRPIDETTVSWMKPTASVPLMFETWEFRDSDLDIQACWQKGIPVLGTDEQDTRVLTQQYVEPLAAKLLFETGFELLNNTVGVIGGGRMAVHAADGLRSLGADVIHVSPVENTPELSRSRDAIRLKDVSEKLSTLDALLIIEHHDPYEILGSWDDMTAAAVADANPEIELIHISGNLNVDGIKAAGLSCTPAEPASFGSMSYTTGHLGPLPVVDLHAAGLVVGELLTRKRRAGYDLSATVAAVREHPLAMDFDDEFYAEHDQSPP